MLVYFGDASLFWWCKFILVAGLYDPLLHCRWVFIAPEDQVVTLNFTRFDIEGQPENETRICPYDFIEASNLGIAMGSQLQLKYEIVKNFSKFQGKWRYVVIFWN